MCPKKRQCQPGVLPGPSSTRRKYVYTPPAGDKLTPSKSYPLLKKTLYGLKRSPRHWYKLATKTLKIIGIVQSIHLPFICHDTPIPGKSLLYLGLYIDDSIYFPARRIFQKHFKASFQERKKVVPGH